MCFGTDRGGAPARVEAPEVARRRDFRGGIAAHRLEEMARQMRAVRDGQLEARERRIDELVAAARERGDDPDRVLWSIAHDTEEAPCSTGRAILLLHRIVPVPPQDLATPEDLHDELWTVIEGLASEGVNLFRTDHLSDADLYSRLYHRILDEPTRVMPPRSEAVEFIDCLHPLDVESGGWGAWLAGRGGPCLPAVPAREGAPARGPLCPTRPADRDRWLAG
jgi:hypothetical protein